MKALIAIALAAFVGVGVGFVSAGPTPGELMVHNKSHHLALAAHSLWGFPITPLPAIVWNDVDDWPHAAVADCDSWTLTVHRPLANYRTDFVLQYMMPHEYGHFVYCYLHDGYIGREPHGSQWAAYVVQLGGDPSYK